MAPNNTDIILRSDNQKNLREMIHLLAKIKNYAIVELTHRLSPSIPTWTARCGFHQTNDLDYKKDGVRVQSIKAFASAGTHMDAPSHFFEEGEDICDYAPSNYFLEGAIIDVSEKVKENPAYFVTPEDVVSHERKYGALSSTTMAIINSGWSHRWPDIDRYRNVDKYGNMVFPGVHPNTAEILLERNVGVIAIDTLSPDGVHLAFPFHHLWLGKGKAIIENLNLKHASMPPRGSVIVNLPQSIQHATEASVRIIGLVSKA